MTVDFFSLFFLNFCNTFHSKGDIGRIGYPGIRGEEGPLVSYLLVTFSIDQWLHKMR